MAIKVKELEAAIKKAANQWAEAEVARNAIGNIALREHDEYVGFIDLNTGEVFTADGDEVE